MNDNRVVGSIILVIGGDARQLEMIRNLHAVGAKILMIGMEHWNTSELFGKNIHPTDVNPKEIDAIVLPVTGIRANGLVDASFSDQPIFVEKRWFEELLSSAIVFTGISTPLLDEWTRTFGLNTIPLLELDDVAIYNSIPTAEGVLMMMIQHTSYTIHGSKITLFGLGRIGTTIARMLSHLGAEVTIVSASTSEIARASEMGLKSVSLADKQQAGGSIDLCLNTIPSLVIDQEYLSYLPAHTLIIDLASAPGGVDQDFAKNRGLKVMKAPGLPGIVAPETAGKILARAIIEQLIQKGQE